MIKAAAAIIEHRGKILIARRRTKDPLHGKWEFPGGKIEDGETPKEGLKRELQEELGVEASIGASVTSTVYKYRHVNVELFIYRATLLTNNIIRKEYDEFKWVSPDELLQHDFPAANNDAIRKLTKGV